METTLIWVFLILLHLIQMLKKSQNITFIELYSYQPVEVQWKEFFFFLSGILPLLLTSVVIQSYCSWASINQHLFCLYWLEWLDHSSDWITQDRFSSWNSYSIWKPVLHNLYVYSKAFENHFRAVLSTWPGIMLVVTGIYCYSQELTRQGKHEVACSPFLA